MQYNSIKLNNIIYFDRATLDLDYKGTTIVQGKNLNANMIGRANGAGKSLLASSIASISQGEPLSQKKYRHTLLDRDDSSIELDITKDGHQYKIKKYRKGRSIKWDIYKDGISLDPRTSTIAENIVSTLLDQNEEEFYTLTYLDSRRLNIIQNGSVADRTKYFTNLLRLYDFDNLRTYFNLSIKDLKDKSIELKAYQEQLADLIWVEDYEDPTNDIKHLNRLIKSYKKKEAYYEEQIQHEKVLEKYGHLSQIDFDLKRYKKLKKIKQYNEEAKEHNNEYQAKLDQYKQWQSTERKLLRDFKSYLKGKNLSGVELYEYCREIYLDFNGRREYLKDVQSEYLKIAEGFQKVAQLGKVEPCKYSKDYCLNKIEDLENQIKSLKKQKGVCSTCGSKLSKEHKAKHTKALKDEIEKWEITLLKATDWETYQLMKQRYCNKSIEDRFNKLHKTIRENKDDFSVDYKFPKGKPIDKPKKRKLKTFDIKEYKKLKQQYQEYQLYKSVKEDLDKARNFKFKKKPNSEKLQKLVTKQASLTQAHKEYERAYSLYQKVSKKIKKLNKELKDLPLLEALSEAYSNKGIKLLVMKNLANKISSNLNKHSHLLFPEPFKFKIDVDINKFDILVKRKDGRISDVRHLSGAESRAFSLLFMLSVLPLIPANRRTNICILDEFEAGLDKPTRELLINDYLPALNTIVPHILFLTPNKIDKQNSINRRIITIVKDNKHSYIEED